MSKEIRWLIGALAMEVVQQAQSKAAQMWPWKSLDVDKVLQQAREIAGKLIEKILCLMGPYTCILGHSYCFGSKNGTKYCIALPVSPFQSINPSTYIYYLQTILR